MLPLLIYSTISTVGNQPYTYYCTQQQVPNNTQSNGCYCCWLMNFVLTYSPLAFNTKKNQFHVNWSWEKSSSNFDFVFLFWNLFDWPVNTGTISTYLHVFISQNGLEPGNHRFSSKEWLTILNPPQVKQYELSKYIHARAACISSPESKGSILCCLVLHQPTHSPHPG